MKNVIKNLWDNVEKITIWFLRLFFKIIHKDSNSRMEQSFLQFVKFGLVGVSNTLLSYSINVVVLLALAPVKVSWDYFAGNIIAFVLSVLWSFYWNNKYVFVKGSDEKRNLWKALFKIYASYSITGIFLNNILSWVWIEIFGILKFVAPIINIFFSVPLNFVLNKYWTFRKEA